MPFGDDNADTPPTPARRLRVCCGPRCGVWPRHRAIYDAVERGAAAYSLAVAPTMCRGLCGNGVTVVDAQTGAKEKARDETEAVALAARFAGYLKTD